MSTKINIAGKSFQASTTTKSRHLITRFVQFILLVSVVLLLSGHEASNPKIGNSIVDFYLDEITTQIHTQSSILLINSDSDTTGNFEDYINVLTARFYKQRSFRPVWTYNYTTTENFDTLIAFIDSLDYIGIPAEILNSYHLSELQKNLKIYKDDESLKIRISLEIHSTRAFFKSLVLSRNGIFTHDTTTLFKKYITQLPDNAIRALEKQSIQKLFKNNQPQILPYSELVNALIPFINNRRLIQSHQYNSLMQDENLLALALYHAGIIDSVGFDSTNTPESAIKQLQKVNKVMQSGIMDSISYSKLASTIEKRFNLICLNLDRLRKMEQNNPDYFFVNIPSYKLWVIKNYKTINTFNVVVGKKQSPTPVLTSKINKIVANPYWTVPRNISRNEIIYKIRKDSTFLQRNGYMIINNKEEVVDNEVIDWSEDDPLGKQFWLRQRYGRGNALGLVKFLFPSKYRIYLHDTPSKSLFKKEYRAYSHGCVRLENPEKLAQHIFDSYLLPKGDTLDIKTLIKSRQRNVVNLPVEIPIYIQYLTCMGSKDGELLFFSDIYNKDNKEVKKLIFMQSQI
jgi:hypothetical protein